MTKSTFTLTRLVTALVLAGATNSILAAPVGGVFRVGGGTINAGPTTNVSVTSAAAFSQSALAVVDWGSFNVGAGETVNFRNDIPSGVTNLMLVNVDNNGSQASLINGALNTINGAGASGGKLNVLIVNSNGVTVGGSAVINTSGGFGVAAGVADTVSPKAGLVTVRLNNAALTVNQAAVINTVANGVTLSPVNFDAAEAQGATIPALYDFDQVVKLDRFNNSIVVNGTTFYGHYAISGAGQTFTMANAGGKRMAVTLPFNSVLAVNDSKLIGNNGFSINNNFGTDVSGGASFINTSIVGGQLYVSGKTGSQALQFTNLSLKNATVKLTEWHGKTNFTGAVTGTGAGNALTMRFGGLGTDLTVNNANVTFSSGNTDVTRNDATYVAPTKFWNEAGKGRVTVNGGSLTLTAAAGAALNDVELTAASITTNASVVTNANMSSAGAINLRPIGAADLQIGMDGSAVNIVGGYVGAGTLSSGNVAIGANSKLQSPNGTRVTVASRGAVTYGGSSQQLASSGQNRVSAPTINGQPTVNTALTADNSGTLVFADVEVFTVSNVAVNGVLQAGTTAPVVPVTPPVTPVTPTQPPVVTTTTPTVVIPTAPVITQTPVVSKVISFKPIEPKVILPAPVEVISTPAEPAPAVVAPEPRKITISADLLFAFDSAELSSDGRSALTKIAGDIEAAGSDDVVTVLGHTDRLGSTKYNQVLSERRAAAVSNFLQEKLQSKIAAKGLGKSQPTEVTAGCSGQRAALISCLQPDRRVEIIVGQK